MGLFAHKALHFFPPPPQAGPLFAELVRKTAFSHPDQVSVNTLRRHPTVTVVSSSGNRMQPMPNSCDPMSSPVSVLAMNNTHSRQYVNSWNSGDEAEDEPSRLSRSTTPHISKRGSIVYADLSTPANTRHSRVSAASIVNYDVTGTVLFQQRQLSRKRLQQVREGSECSTSSSSLGQLSPKGTPSSIASRVYSPLATGRQTSRFSDRASLSLRQYCADTGLPAGMSPMPLSVGAWPKQPLQHQQSRPLTQEQPSPQHPLQQLESLREQPVAREVQRAPEVVSSHVHTQGRVVIEV